MNEFLHEVVEERQQDVATLMERIPIEELQRAASEPFERPSLMDRLMVADDVESAMIIAEVKQASPTAGIIREHYNPDVIATAYEKSGAAGISVLTEPRHFLGSLEHLEMVKNAVSIPVLRKDFITEIYQLYESAVAGADVVLLIACAMDFSRLRDLYVVALAIGLEVIVEVHSHEELEMVLPLARAIIGVNNRDLETLETDVAVSRYIARDIPPGRVAISESGINSRDDIVELRELGYKGFLIGEALLRFRNPGIALRTLAGQPSALKNQ